MTKKIIIDPNMYTPESEETDTAKRRGVILQKNAWGAFVDDSFEQDFVPPESVLVVLFTNERIEIREMPPREAKIFLNGYNYGCENGTRAGSFIWEEKLRYSPSPTNKAATEAVDDYLKQIEEYTSSAQKERQEYIESLNLQFKTPKSAANGNVIEGVTKVQWEKHFQRILIRPANPTDHKPLPILAGWAKKSPSGEVSFQEGNGQFIEASKAEFDLQCEYAPVKWPAIFHLKATEGYWRYSQDTIEAISWPIAKVSAGNS